MLKKISLLTLPAAVYFSLAVPAFAQTINPCPKEGSGTNYLSLCRLNKDTIDAVIRNSITILFFVATIAALFFLIFGGIRWITSGGDKAGVESARNMIIAAVIGLILTFLSFLIINIVLQLIGLNTVTSGVKLPNLID
jgi:hypothetical protein